MNEKKSKQTQEKIILTRSVRHPSETPKRLINIEKKILTLNQVLLTKLNKQQ